MGDHGAVLLRYVIHSIVHMISSSTSESVWGLLRIDAEKETNEAHFSWSEGAPA